MPTNFTKLIAINNKIAQNAHMHVYLHTYVQS